MSVPAPPLLRVYLLIYLSDYVLDLLVPPLLQPGQVSWRHLFLNLYRYALPVLCVCLVVQGYTTAMMVVVVSR